MANKTIDFQDLRTKKGIGLRYFLWDIPKELLGSMVVGITGGSRVLQIGGLVAGLATAAGAVTALGVTVLGIAGSIFTVFGLGVGVFNLVKQHKDREERIEKIVGDAGSLEKLKKQLASLAKNLPLLYTPETPLSEDDKKDLHKILFSLSAIKGSNLKEKLKNLYGLAEGQNLAQIMSVAIGDDDPQNADAIERGLSRLEIEFSESVNSVKNQFADLLADLNEINLDDLYGQLRSGDNLTEQQQTFRENLRQFIEACSALPGESLMNKLGYLHGLDEKSAKDTQKIFKLFPLDEGISYENLHMLEKAIQSEAQSQFLELLIAQHNQPENIAVLSKKMKTFEKTTLSLIPGSNNEEKLLVLFNANRPRDFDNAFTAVADHYQAPTDLSQTPKKWAEKLLEAKKTLDNYPTKKFNTVKDVLENGLSAVVGSLSGFGIVVGIAGFAGVSIATGGVGLIVLLVACAAATLGAALFVAATKNTQNRQKQFEEEDKTLADYVTKTTKKTKSLNKAMHLRANPQRVLEDTPELTKLKKDNQRLKKELANRESVSRREAREAGIFGPSNPQGKRPPPPNYEAPQLPPELDSSKTPDTGKGKGGSSLN